MLQQDFKYSDMALFNGMMQDCAASIVLLERVSPLVQEIVDHFGVATTAGIDKRSATLRTCLVNIGLATGDKSLDHIDVTLNCGTVQRCETSMISRVHFESFRKVTSDRRLDQ